VVDCDLLCSEPVAQSESDEKRFALVGVAPALRSASICELEAEQVGRPTRRAPSSAPATSSASGSPNNRAARADASTTLTAVTVGPDQNGSLAGCLQAEPADFGQNVGSRRRLILPSRSFDDRQEFTLQRPMMPFRPLPQSLHDIVRRILDRKVYRHGSILAPLRIIH
jgi:hypothetical protein